MRLLAAVAAVLALTACDLGPTTTPKPPPPAAAPAAAPATPTGERHG